MRYFLYTGTIQSDPEENEVVFQLQVDVPVNQLAGKVIYHSGTLYTVGANNTAYFYSGYDDICYYAVT